MADDGNNLPSSVHIQPFNKELILVVLNHTKEPVKDDIDSEIFKTMRKLK